MAPMTDFRGVVFFQCATCGLGLNERDFYELGMRIPDWGESRDEYCDAELIDDVTHSDCQRARAV